MFSLIKKIQDIIVNKKQSNLDNLVYKNYIHKSRPTELESYLPFKYIDLIDCPPSNSSDITKAEIQHLIKETSNIPLNIKETILLIDEDPLIIYKTILKKYSLPFPQNKFDTLYALLYEIVSDLKILFNRPRPNQIAEFYNLNIDVIHTGTHHTPAYPSGHVAYAALAEQLLTVEFPHLKDELAEATRKVMLARVKQGVHFPSDNDASVLLVKNLFNDLIQYTKGDNNDQS